MDMNKKIDKTGKKLGVIGGMGPEATSYFYESLIAHTVADRDQDHIDMVILSHASMPDRTGAILAGGDREEDLLRKLIEDAKTLERLGASNIAIPCNTSHYYYEQIQNAVGISIINMVEESVKAAASRISGTVKESHIFGTPEESLSGGGLPKTSGAQEDDKQAAFGSTASGRPQQAARKIGIMATDGTLRSGVYDKVCQALGIQAVHPSKDRQRDVMSLIYDEVKQGKPGDPDKFRRVTEELIAAGCDTVILACTELSVFKSKNQIPEFCLDAMDILVRESILRSGANYK
ncbi:MAG: amino acid racemase [Bacillota bacterium]|nr:amino acid racemase [Bacillota bacterium]